MNRGACLSCDDYEPLHGLMIREAFGSEEVIVLARIATLLEVLLAPNFMRAPHAMLGISGSASAATTSSAEIELRFGLRLTAAVIIAANRLTAIRTLA